MEEALNQVRKLAAESEDNRRKAMVALRDLSSSLENLHDTIHKYGHMVWFTPVTEPDLS